MPNQVVNNALLMCSMGLAPGTLGVLPLNRVMSSNQPAANIMDHLPMVNIKPFGMCRSPANPQVAAATAAAMGVLTPQPCIPVTSSPWMPGSPTVLIANQPALNDTSMCLCNWLGSISVSFAGQVTHQIP